MPKIHHLERENFEKLQSKDGHDFKIKDLIDGKLVAAAKRDIYFPLTYISSNNDDEKYKGGDAYSLPLHRNAMDMAQHSDQLNLFAMKLEIADKAPGLLAFMPVYYSQPSNEKERKKLLKGFISATIKAETIFNGTARNSHSKSLI